MADTVPNNISESDFISKRRKLSINNDDSNNTVNVIDFPPQFNFNFTYEVDNLSRVI